MLKIHLWGGSFEVHESWINHCSVHDLSGYVRESQSMFVWPLQGCDWLFTWVSKLTEKLLYRLVSFLLLCLCPRPVFPSLCQPLPLSFSQLSLCCCLVSFLASLPPSLILLSSPPLSCSLTYLSALLDSSSSPPRSLHHTLSSCCSTWVCPLLPPSLLPLIHPNLHLSPSPHSFLWLSQEPFSLSLSLCLWAELYWERLAGRHRGKEGARVHDEARGERIEGGQDKDRKKVR